MTLIDPVEEAYYAALAARNRHGRELEDAIVETALAWEREPAGSAYEFALGERVRALRAFREERS